MAFSDYATLQDAFARGDQSPLGGIWSIASRATDGFTIVSQVAQASGVNELDEEYVTSGNWGPDVEAWAKIVNTVAWGYWSLLVRGVDYSGSTPSGYFVQGGTGSFIKLWLLDGGDDYALSSEMSQSHDADDLIGIDVIGSLPGTIRAWFNEEGSGGWSQVGSDQTDSVLSAAGTLAVAVWLNSGSGSDMQFDNVYVGTIPSGPTEVVKDIISRGIIARAR